MSVGRFKSDEPIVCSKCGHVVGAGEFYYMFECEDYCSEECVREVIERDHPDATDEEQDDLYDKGTEYKYLKTAYDRYCEYEDEAYDRLKDERLCGD